MKTYQWLQMQLYCNLCNYFATIFSNIGEWSNATILQLMKLYATILKLMQLYTTILQLMQLYETYATILQQFHMQLCNYATMQHATYATSTTLWNLCNFTQLYATLRNLCNYATICNLCCLATICNYMTDRCGNFNFMQLNATICNYVGTILQLMQLYATICT